MGKGSRSHGPAKREGRESQSRALPPCLARSRVRIWRMRSVLCVVLCLLAPLPWLGALDRPNVVWLSAEDIGPHLRCYGDPHAITPNLDALAVAGVRYTRAFTTAGVCAPSRSGIITGMYQNSIGTHHMRCDATLPGWLKPFPLYLREAGYYCTNNSKTDYQFSKPSPAEIWDESSAKAHWKNRPEGSPFFAVFNFTGCHESGIADEEKYQKVTSGLAPEQRQNPAALSTLPPYYPDTPVVREDWKRNYELITAMDAWAGGLIAELKEAGLFENTVVMFWSDHGVGLPRAKRWLYDSGTRVPLIVRYPESMRSLVGKGQGETEGRLVSSVDFAPTMLYLLGLEVPEHLQGMPFVGETRRDYAFGARDRMDERYDVIRSARNERYRYVRNFEPLKPYYQYMNTPERGATMREIRNAEKVGKLTEVGKIFSAPTKPTEELYDLESDSDEIRNLADDPAHSAALHELRAALRDWQLEIGDLGLVPESEIEKREPGAGSAFAILHGREDRAVFLDKLEAVATLASKGPDGLPDLIEALDHNDAAIRYWGATGIGNFAEQARDEAGLTAALNAALEDKSPAVAIAAARALCRMGLTSKGLATLSKHLVGKNEWARLEAAIVLDELDETARPALATLKEALHGDENKYVVRVVNKAINDLAGTDKEVP